MKAAILIGLVGVLAYLIYQDYVQQQPAIGGTSSQPSPPEGASSLPSIIDFGSLRSTGVAIVDQITDIVDEAINRVADVANGKATSSIVSTWADAIEHFEGGKPGDRNMRNNNPGNLEPPNLNPRFYQGQTGLDGVFAVFDTYANGRRALEMDIRIKLNRAKNLGQSILDVMSIYAPPTQNPTKAYADYVATALGVTADTLVSALAV